MTSARREAEFLIRPSEDASRAERATVRAAARVRAHALDQRRRRVLGQHGLVALVGAASRAGTHQVWLDSWMVWCRV